MSAVVKHVLALLAVALVLFAQRASAGTPLEIYTDKDDPVPVGPPWGGLYKSWSLFLVCSAEWVPDDVGKLEELHRKFSQFGLVMGREHAAIWFQVSRDDSSRESVLDVWRSTAFCGSLKLAPSGSPYIIVTTQYPGAGRLSMYPKTFPTEDSPLSVISLAGMSTGEIKGVLMSLAAKIALNNLSELDPSKEEWWRALEHAYDVFHTEFVGAPKGMTLKIKTAFFEKEF
jgi:hypothetical protein